MTESNGSSDLLTIKFSIELSHKECQRLVDRLKNSRRKNIKPRRKEVSPLFPDVIKLHIGNSTCEIQFSNKYMDLIDIIRNSIENNNTITGKFSYRVEPNMNLLKNIIAKIKGVILLNYRISDSCGLHEWAFESTYPYLTNSNVTVSTRYINVLASLPTVPSISVIRFRSQKKAEISEHYDIHTDGLKIHIEEEDGSGIKYWVNNYIKRRREKKDIERENDDQTFKNWFGMEEVTKNILASMRGIVDANGFLLPWPLSTFEFADRSYNLYTMFLLDFKIIDIKNPVSSSTLAEVFSEGIRPLNYDNYSNRTVKINAEVFLQEDLSNSIKPIKLEIVGLKELIDKFDLNKGKTVMGAVIGKVFSRIYEAPLFLTHIYDESRSDFIQLVDEINNDLYIQPNELLSRKFILKLKNIIYEKAYKNKPIGRLNGNDELLELTRRVLTYRKIIFEKITGITLKPNLIFSAGYIFNSPSQIV